MDNDLRHLVEFGPFRVDPAQRLLFPDAQPVPLSPKAFDLLLALLQRNGEVVLKDDLMKQLWPNTFVEESNLGQHVFQIRKALGEKAQGSSYIVTVPGRGYRFAQSVRPLPKEEDEIVLESHSRSRVVIEGNSLSAATHLAQIGMVRERELTALPPAIALGRPRPRWMAALLLLGVVVGGLAMWIFFRSARVPKVARTVHITHFGMVEPFSQALTDGLRVYFAERVGGTRTLAQVSDQGGESTMIPSSVLDIAVHDIDRRGSRLLVTSGTSEAGSPLWIVSTIGGDAQRVDDVLADSAAWSPDQQRIAYSRESDLFAANIDGSKLQKLFTGSGIVEYLRWSPDGSRISFTVRNFSGTLSLWEISADGGNPHPVSFGWQIPIRRWGEGECCGDWSPDGKYFIFRSRRDRIASVWIVPQQKTLLQRANAPVQLYSCPDRLNQPRFSADGKKIFLVHYHERFELARYDSAKQTFAPYLGGIPGRQLSFSSDGQWVTYKNEPDGTLWRSRADGTDALQLTTPPLEIYHPTWSPDGKEIAFESNSGVYSVSAAGGSLHPFIPEDANARQPSWSPDGETVLYTSGTPAERPSIYSIDLKTRRREQVPHSQNLEVPRWSPDGRYVTATDSMGWKLMLFDYVTHTWSELATGASFAWGVRWSTDSKYVYYQHIFGGQEQPIFRVRVSDREVEQVTSSKEILSADVLSYSLTGLTPDNSPLVSFLHRNSDIYALELDFR